MIDPLAPADRLRRLVRAAPGAFREDRIFRYALIGAVVALLMLPSSFGEPAASVPAPPAPPTPTELGRAHVDHSAGSATPIAGPIAPGRPLNSAVVRPDAQSEPDRFGTLAAARPEPKRPPE